MTNKPWYTAPMHRNDLLALLSVLIGIGSLATDAAFGAQINTIFGGHAGSIVLASIGAIGVIASQVLRVFGSPSGRSLQTYGQPSYTWTVPAIAQSGFAPVPDAPKPDAPKPAA